MINSQWFHAYYEKFYNITLRLNFLLVPIVVNLPHANHPDFLQYSEATKHHLW